MITLAFSSSEWSASKVFFLELIKIKAPFNDLFSDEQFINIYVNSVFPDNTIDQIGAQVILQDLVNSPKSDDNRHRRKDLQYYLNSFGF